MILIAGAGIGGLTAALALRRAGRQVVVFEAADEIRPLGVGINLLPHAVRVLTELGLGPALDAAGIRTAELLYFSKHGKRIWREPRGIDAGYPVPQYSIHRGRLQQILLEAVMQVAEVRAGHRLESFDLDGRARFSNGFALQGDALIGADGIHSAVRKYFYPDEGEPAFSGKILWRAVTEAAPFLTGRSMIMAGHARQKFVAYPISPEAMSRGRSLVNWIAELHLGGDAAPRRDWNRRVSKDVFASAFASWKFDWLDVPALIDGASEVFEFPMVDRDPVPRWSFDRVTLLGDAAHPMYPVGSNGASQAILDAWALAEAVAANDDMSTALRIYQEQRLAPTAAIVHSNRKQGPEAVMQIVEERAPNGFEDLSTVISQAELEEIAARYKQTAGFALPQNVAQR